MIRNLGELGLSLQNIMTRLLSDQTLLKLLYYTDKNPYSQTDLSDETIKDEIFNKLIKIVPKVDIKEDSKSIIALTITTGTQNSNAEFRNFQLNIEVFVPLTQWIIKDSNLRPFAIMGEVQNVLNNKDINGVGKLVGGDFELTVLTDEISCYTMIFNFEQFR